MESLSGTPAAEFSTNSLIAAGQTCATDESNSLLGTVFLSTNPSLTGSQRVKQIGDQYLYYSHGQAACSKSGSITSLTNSFENALNSAQSIQ
jgi:hypothetical protein